MKALGLLFCLAFATQAGSGTEWFTPHADGKPLRIVFLGTSITCGTGASAYGKAFPPLLTADIEKLAGTKVQEFNLCLGGSISPVQLAVLKYEVVPLKPDLLVMEVGTLDELFKLKLGEPALEAMFRLIKAEKIPTIAFYPFTSYAALQRKTVVSLANQDRIPILDIEQHANLRRLSILNLTEDRVHANDRGHALIRKVLSDYLRLRKPLIAANGIQHVQDDSFSKIQFVPAHQLLPQQGWVPLQHFSALGSGISCENGCDLSFSIEARLVVLVFNPSDGPIQFSYRVDGKEWSPPIEQPNWLISYPLLSEERASSHRIELKLRSNVAGILMLQ
ncbi:MAG TPA: SGNH/GDSL hydrolase family protein [Pyrinomonadaceae bacterium]|nr:SGNH/GDSL hydrolase family protein [Pyrinomonadaceae bacterium]